jgi:hypothetical protein
LKLVVSDGRTLSVWQICDVPVFKLHAAAYPIKCHGCRIMTDDAARDLLRELRAAQTEGSCDVDAV